MKQHEKYLFSYAIFERTLETIDEHKREFYGNEGRTMQQALNWWERLPEIAKENLRTHTFERKETFNDVFDFYWAN